MLRSDLVVLTGGKVLQMLLLFFAVRLFTTYLSDKEIGNLILIISVASFFGMAAINPIGSFINRKLNCWKEAGKITSNFFNFNYYVILVSLLALLSPYMLFLSGIGNSINTLWFAVLLSLFVYFNTWNQTIIPSLNLLFFRRAFVLFTVISTALYLLLSSIIVRDYNATALGWFSGQISGLALGLFLALIFFVKHVIKNENKSESKIQWASVRDVSKFSVPLSIATLLFWILGNSYKLIVEGVLSAEELAYIGLGLSLATSLAGAIESLLMQVFHAPFYKGLAESTSQDQRAILFQSFINNTIPVIGVALFVLIVISPFILSILADSRFLSAYLFLMAGLFIEFLRVSANVIGHAAHSEYKTQKNITPYLWGAGIASLSTFMAVFTSNWQLLVIVSLSISWLITLLLMVNSAKKLLEFTFPWKVLSKLIFYSLPVVMVSFTLWGEAKNIAVSLSITCGAGLYMSIVLFYQYKNRGVDV